MKTISGVSEAVAEVLRAFQEGSISHEQAADAMLQAWDALGKSSGAYTRLQWARKVRLEQKRLGGCRPANAAYAEQMVRTAQSWLDELIELAGLRPVEEICLRLSADGLGPKLIARATGIGLRRVDVYLRIARRKVRQVYDDGPYAGWREVYLSEMRRTGSRRRCARDL